MLGNAEKVIETCEFGIENAKAALHRAPSKKNSINKVLYEFHEVLFNHYIQIKDLPMQLKLAE